MKLTNEQVKSITDNILRYLKNDISLAERVSLNAQELASFVATAAAKDVKKNWAFAEEIPLANYLPEITLGDKTVGIPEENIPLVNAKVNAAESAYIADFCKKLTEQLKITAHIKPSPAIFAAKEKEKLKGGRVAFSESHMLSSAFEEFKKHDRALTASFVRSFSDACEDVYSGECEWCILPIENSRDGALLSVYNLIEKYELCISRICSINNEDFNTKFALLCSGVHGIIEIQNEQNAVLRMPIGSSAAWARIYTGAALLGVELIKTVAIPLGYTDGYAHICTFCGNGESLFAFLLFLSIIRADFTLMGTYQ